MFIRRTAVLRLVQMVAGGSLGEAAGFLGIASADTTWLGKRRIYSGAGFVHSGARQQPDPLGFETALNVLARELNDTATPLINYQQRRQALGPSRKMQSRGRNERGRPGTLTGGLPGQATVVADGASCGYASAAAGSKAGVSGCGCETRNCR